MLRLSKRLLFAIEAVADIAYYGGQRPVQSGEISERQGIPRRYLEQVLQHLVKNGILTGQRGPRGGYRLARERRLITVGELVRVVRQIDALPDPLTDEGGSAIGNQVIRPIWRDMQNRMMQELDSVTVEEICERARRTGVPGEPLPRIDFSI
ncbi:MAG: Rrf2 family transcriptional regulator [Rhodospirillaceae bacterium]|nr:Rrf2 family transcriptional regulator [Rhodospirillaceae bacterium]